MRFPPIRHALRRGHRRPLAGGGTRGQQPPDKGALPAEPAADAQAPHRAVVRAFDGTRPRRLPSPRLGPQLLLMQRRSATPPARQAERHGERERAGDRYPGAAHPVAVMLIVAAGALHASFLWCRLFSAPLPGDARRPPAHTAGPPIFSVCTPRRPETPSARGPEAIPVRSAKSEPCAATRSGIGFLPQPQPR